MHIAIFHQYYRTPDCPGDPRPYALVETLRKDHNVTVITTRVWEDRRQTTRVPWEPSGVHLVPFDIPYNNRMSSRRRLISFLRYAERAFQYGLQMPRPDLIIGSSPPLTVSAVSGMIGKLRGVPWIFEVQDLWPDFPIQMGAVPDYGLHDLLRWGETALYRSATQVVTLSPDMEQHVRIQAPEASVTTLEYGSDLDRIDATGTEQTERLRERFSLDRRFLVLYAGSFGRANAIPTLLEAAQRLIADRSDVLVAFVGDGHHAAMVQRVARAHDAVRKIPPQPYPETLALFKLADVSLVSFVDRPVLTVNSPGKFYDSLATGTPVVVTNPGWTKRFVDRHACGWFVPPESPIALARRLKTVLRSPASLTTAGQNAEQAARQHFDRADLMDQYATLVERTV